MPIAEARIKTERPSRYLIQLCKHAASMGAARGHLPRVHLGGMLTGSEVRVRADWSDTHGTVIFIPWGQCTIAAGADTLTVRIDATDEQNLQRMQDIITRDLERFGRRDHLSVNWHRNEDQEGTSQ